MGLFKPAWMSENEIRALSAMAKENDLDKLAEIAQTAQLASVREVAVARLSALRKRRERRTSGAAVNPCPKCGVEMVEVEYYTAIPGASKVVGQKSEWSGMGRTTTTTTSTQYTDIQRQTGCICLYCDEKRSYTLKVTGRVMLILGLMMIIAAAVIGFNDGSFLIPGAVGVLTVMAGWRFATDYACSYRPEKSNPPTIEDIRSNGTMHDMASASLVSRFPKKKIPQGRVFLSRSIVREMYNGNRRS